MTALTTILGCVPLALEPEPGKQQVFLGLGRALIGGLTLGTVLTLFVVPLAYTFLDDFGLFLRSFFSHFGLTRRLLIGRAR
jgi:HAE1 family hydrophobic/amphiphilic exporter-1